jgi:hypothetical protein
MKKRIGAGIFLLLIGVLVYWVSTNEGQKIPMKKPS